MKVAISTDQGYVSAHFGRCSTYTVIEIKEGQMLSREEMPNPGHQPGFLPQFLSEKGVNCIIAGGMGPRAQALFAQKNIETIIGIQGTVDEVIEKFIKQELEAGEDLCGHRHGEPGPYDQDRGEVRPAAGKRICITSRGKDLGSEVDPRFGRANYFLFIDPVTMDLEVLENPNTEGAQGAGIQSAQLISSKNVKAILTGNCGPNAERVLQAAGIKVITGVSGTVEAALSKHKTEVS
ncbi:MAG: NifB/NifX family molybdenum-iron cluster-binding protein [Candidatus Aminicenantes bacterium]|nr:NifB/NifX family molybdenum-iron cluster-binding protein [Candidatus Aminicenantes bacterium]MDH5705682.1 NifB/NifX family molybdenum-iron cluster-binding protein [Candidatus Aminicenantes bacterium]